MKVYLATVTIVDSEHEHTSYALIKAKSLTEAENLAEAEVEKKKTRSL
jgi:hypothetical protein